MLGAITPITIKSKTRMEMLTDNMVPIVQITAARIYKEIIKTFLLGFTL
jgi:hypothetical protein